MTPSAEASGTVALQTPSALTRSVPSVNEVVRIESAAGVIIAAPSPWASRAAIITASLPARPAVREDSANSDGPGDE